MRVPPETLGLSPRLEAPEASANSRTTPRKPDAGNLDAALALAVAGWHVFPLRAGSKVPLLPRAHSKDDAEHKRCHGECGTFGHGCWDGTTDEATVREWWTADPRAGVAVNLGDDRIAFDVDLNHGGRFLDSFPATRTHHSGRGNGNAHLIYRFEPGSLASQIRPGNAALGAGMDIKTGRGSYIVAPPTLHEETGKPYTVGLENGGEFHVLTEAEVRAIFAEAGVAVPGERATGGSATVPQKNQPVTARPTLAELLQNPPTRGAGATNDWLTRVAGHYAKMHRDKRDLYEVEVRRAAQLVEGEPYPAEEVEKTLESIWATDAENHGQDDSKDSPTVLVIGYAREQYDFYSTPEGEVFATAKSGNRRPILMGENGSGAIKSKITADLFEQSGKVPSTHAVEDALRVIYAQTVNNPNAHDLDLRIAERPGMLVLDLAEPGTGRCVVITPSGWSVQDNPPVGVLFRLTRTTKPIPAPSRDGDLDLLRLRLTWEANDPRWVLVSGWLAAACLPSIPRPLLAFTGQPGSAKTTRARLVLSVIDPRNELGSSFGKNEGDEQAMAGGRYLVGWDNISRTGDEVSDRLCRVVTGEESVKRKLYTDSDQSIIAFRRTGAITAVTLPNLRADALERLIPVACDRIEGRNRQSEAKIRQAFEADHPRILGGLMDSLVVMLGNLEASRDRDADRVRMADFQDALHALNPEVATVYAESVRNVMVEAAEADPFVSAVVEWLATQNLPLTLQTKQAWHDASTFRERLSAGDPEQWWPKSATAFSKLLLKNTEPLNALGVQVDYSRRTKQGRQLVFFRPGQSTPVELDGSDQ